MLFWQTGAGTTETKDRMGMMTREDHDLLVGLSGDVRYLAKDVASTCLKMDGAIKGNTDAINEMKLACARCQERRIGVEGDIQQLRTTLESHIQSSNTQETKESNEKEQNVKDEKVWTREKIALWLTIISTMIMALLALVGLYAPH